MRTRVAVVSLVLGVLAGLGGAAASAQTLVPQVTVSGSLKPTDKCPQAQIDQMQKVITFVEGRSWSEHPGDEGLRITPDTTNCRVVLAINKVSSVEQAALEQGGQGLLSIQKTKDYGKPSRLPLLLWVIFGGSGVVFIFLRYGRQK